MSTTIRYLKATIALRERAGIGPNKYRYHCTESLVLAEGHEFPQRMPTAGEALEIRSVLFRAEAKYGFGFALPRTCYRTAYRLAQFDRRFTYCEGYARHPAVPWPTLHAWNLFEGRLLVDTVWPDEDRKIIGSWDGDRGYFGIEFPLKILAGFRKHYHRRDGCYLDFYEAGWPLQKFGPDWEALWKAAPNVRKSPT